MKKVLVIGSTVVDIIIRLNILPTTGADINVRGQKMSLGGCAFNVSQAIAYWDVPYLLFSATGTGIYADYIRKHTNEMGVNRADINPDEPNGCCYSTVLLRTAVSVALFATMAPNTDLKKNGSMHWTKMNLPVPIFAVLRLRSLQGM